MNRVLLVVDEISTWVGKTAGWCPFLIMCAMVQCAETPRKVSP